MIMILGIYCTVFSIVVGIPAHLVLLLLRVKSIFAYGMIGFVAGASIFLALAGLDTNNITAPVWLGGLIGLLDAVIFSFVYQKFSK